MRELTSTKWKRRGSSIVWHPGLLGDLIEKLEAVPLRTLLSWQKNGFPPSPAANAQTVLVGGLQTVVETMMQTQSLEAVAEWLRLNILGAVRMWKSHWPNVGLVFVMDGPASLFEFNEADELVYFGRGRDRAKKVKLSAAIWNGAASSAGAYKLPVTKADAPSTAPAGEVGGYYVEWLS